MKAINGYVGLSLSIFQIHQFDYYVDIPITRMSFEKYFDVRVNKMKTSHVVEVRRNCLRHLKYLRIGPRHE